MHALARIADVRAAIAADVDLKSALQPATPAPPFASGNLRELIAAAIGGFVSTYLWPLITLVVLAGLIGGLSAAWSAHGAWHWIVAFVLGSVRVLWGAAWVALAGCRCCGDPWLFGAPKSGSDRLGRAALVAERHQQGDV